MQKCGKKFSMENDYYERYYLSLWYYWTDDIHRHQTNENEIFSTKIITQVLTFFGQNLRRNYVLIVQYNLS